MERTPSQEADRIVSAIESLGTLFTQRLATIDARLTAIEAASSTDVLARIDKLEAGLLTNMRALNGAQHETAQTAISAREACVTARQDVSRLVDALLGRVLMGMGQPAVQPVYVPEVIQPGHDADGRTTRRTPHTIESAYAAALPNPDALAGMTDASALLALIASSAQVATSTVRAALDGAKQHPASACFQPLRDWAATKNPALAGSLREAPGVLRVLAGPTLLPVDSDAPEGETVCVPWYVRIMAQGTEACDALLAERAALKSGGAA